MRKWLKISEKHRTACMLKFIALALTDPIGSRRTDIIGLACQYGKSFGVRRPDFDEIIYQPLSMVLESVEGKK